MRWLLLSALLAVALVSCGKSEAVRRLFYPPGFHYLSEDDIRGDMGGLALQVQALDKVMARSEAPRPDDQQRMISILEEMQTHVRHLSRGQQSNHPEIDRDAPMLERRIDRALFGARMNPPNYYFAGTVAGVCTYCHGKRHQTGLERESAKYSAAVRSDFAR